MLRVFRDAGYETTRHVEYGEVTLEFAVDETEVTEAVMREREQRAEARSIAGCCIPRRSRSSGRATTRARSATRSSATCCGWASTARSTRSTRMRGTCAACGPTRLSPTCPDDIDLVVIAVPAAAVPASSSSALRAACAG